MGNFTTGFFGAIGDKLKDVADRHKANEDKLRDIKANSLHDAISSGNLNHEQMTAALDELQKLYPKSKGIKGAFDKVRQIGDLFHKGPQSGARSGQGQPQTSAPGQPPAMSEQIPGANASSTGPNAPSLPARTVPSASDSAPQSPQSGGSAPKSAPATPPSMADIMSAAHPSPQSQDDRAFDYFKRQKELEHKFKMEEQDALQKAKAANPTGRPVMGPAISTLNARELAKQGRTFNDKDGNPIDLTSLPDTMGLKNIVWGGKSFYEPFSPNSKMVTVGNETFAVSPMDVEALKQGAGTDLGVHNAGVTRRTTDPATGQTTTSTSKPNTPGVAGRGSSPSAPPKMSDTAPAEKSSASPSSKSAATTGELPKLDGQGHIPNNYIGSTPQVIEGANQLLDGTDKDKLPAKTRELSSALARRYGWEQGKFTPKEQLMLREATTFLNEAATNPSMSVLDSTGSKLKLGQVLASSHDQGFIGRTASTLAASNMTEQEGEFVRMYNQLVGTISGLSQLVRSGRATEAQIDRLKNELPNVLNAKDAADGRKRIQRILKEVDIAMKKGTFEGMGSTMLSEPPKGPMAASKPSVPSGNVIRWTRDANNNPVPVSQ